MIPATLHRFTRFSSDLDGPSHTTRVRGPIQTARSCRVGGSRGGPTRIDGCRPSRGAKGTVRLTGPLTYKAYTGLQRSRAGMSRSYGVRRST